jgi:SAM-dependent methyltransferase
MRAKRAIQALDEVAGSRKTIYPHVKDLIAQYSQHAEHTLEIGCGSAQYSQYVSGDYFGLDLPKKLDQSTGPDVFADGQQLPYKSDYFDFAFFVAVLHVIANPQNALDECYRVLKPGGKLLVFDYNLPATKRLAKLNNEINGLTTHIWSPWMLADNFRRAGFQAQIEWDYVRGNSHLAHLVQRYKIARFLRFWIWQVKNDWSIVSGTKPQE